MISIEGLLEDEQGLSMGELLTVKFHQPSHEFTFGVGMNFMSYPLVLTPLLMVQNRAQVHRKPTGDLVPFFTKEGSP
jgi:hypothetical protein